MKQWYQKDHLLTTKELLLAIEQQLATSFIKFSAFSASDENNFPHHLVKNAKGAKLRQQWLSLCLRLDDDNAVRVRKWQRFCCCFFLVVMVSLVLTKVGQRRIPGTARSAQQTLMVWPHSAADSKCSSKNAQRGLFMGSSSLVRHKNSIKATSFKLKQTKKWIQLWIKDNERTERMTVTEMQKGHNANFELFYRKLHSQRSHTRFFLRWQNLVSPHLERWQKKQLYLAAMLSSLVAGSVTMVINHQPGQMEFVELVEFSLRVQKTEKIPIQW